MRSRRALLYVPGSDLHKIEKAAALDVDGVILDLEDSVSANRKDDARVIVGQALNSLNFGRSERLVRINPFYSGRAQADLEAALPGKPDAIVVPKVDSPDILAEVDEIITRAEAAAHLAKGSIEVIATIESAQRVCEPARHLRGY